MLGQRVVRGPDWKWADQDGGEGRVGTIVNVSYQRGGGDSLLSSPIQEKTVIVQWDGAKRTNYRIGHGDAYDLRLYDSAPAGAKHSHVICDICRVQPICGIRWKCQRCYDFDLCSQCYHAGKHNTNHEFWCIEDGARIEVGPRTSATRIEALGFFPGAKVKRGADWEWENQDGGIGQAGRVTAVRGWGSESDRSVVTVRWPKGTTNVYRVGHRGKVDLKCIEAAEGGTYYRDHLPVLGRPRPKSSMIETKTRTAMTSSSAGRSDELKLGDWVSVILEANLLRVLQEGHGGWNPKMEEVIGKPGKVNRVTERGNVRVKFVIDGAEIIWMFHPKAVSKIVQSSDKEVPSDQENEVHFQEIYDDALKRGSVTVNRSRVIVTGQDGAGKSCLVDSLLNRPFERDKASTEGAVVAMTHTATSGWLATDRKDHLDSLIAQGVYSSMNQRRSNDFPVGLHVDRSLQNVSSESAISGAAVTESGFQTFSPELSSAPPPEDLKAVGIEAKTLTPNQQELVSTFLVTKPSEEDLKRQILGVRDLWDLGGQEIYLATHSALMPENETFGLTMYMVVMDISKSLSDKAESFYRSSEGEVVNQTNELGWIRTNGDFPFYWFGSITAAHEETTRDSHWLGEDEEVDSPPVFAIGSHRDVLDSDKNRFPNSAAVNKWLLQQGDLLEQLLMDSEFVKHIVLPKKHEDANDDENFREMTHFVKRIFLIDNSVSGSDSPCKTVNEIRRRVDRMTWNYWRRQKKQPLFWVYLEILLFRWKEVMKTAVAKVDEVIKLAKHRSICNISRRDEVLVALKYLANVGAILYYPEVDDLKMFVFTSPTWVIKAMSAFVTAAKPGPRMEPKWHTLKQTGVMAKDLMDYRLKQMREASDFTTDLDLEDENRLIVRLLQLLDVIMPVAGSPPSEFYVPSMLQPFFLYPRTYWEGHSRSPPFPAPLIVIPMKLKFFPECLYFRLVTRFLKMYPKNPELSRHQCVFLVEDKDSTAEVEIELLYHSRGNYVALTVHYVNEDDVAKTSSFFLQSIKEQLCRQMKKICYQGMGGFDYSVCCQLEEAVRGDEHLDINLKDLPVLCTKKVSKYCPKDGKLCNNFGKRVPVDPEDFSRINCWFGVQPIDDKFRSIQGALPDVVDECLIRVVATLAEAQWQKLALCLGRKGHAIPQYKEKSSEDSIRAAIVIEDWYAERGPSAATVIRLIQACEKCGIHRDHIASAYKEEL